MKHLYILLLLCLVAAGPAAALAIGPGSVAVPVKATLAIRYTTMVPVKTQYTLVTTTGPGQAPISPMLYISSTPSGADVAVNGHAKGKTPLTLGLSPGTYTVVITLAGYDAYNTTVTLQDSDKVAIDAHLQQALSAGALRQSISDIAPAIPARVINRTTLTVPVTTTRGMTQCPPDQKCMTLAEAEVAFQPGWEPAGTGPCDTVLDTDNEVIGYRYCIVGNLKPTLQPGAIQSIAVARQVSLVPVSFQTTSITAPGETKKPLGEKRQVGFFDWFRGLFSFMQPVCPSGQSACYGKCVDLMTDSQNCGSCYYTCFDPAVCSGGQCVAPSLPQANVSGLL